MLAAIRTLLLAALLDVVAAHLLISAGGKSRLPRQSLVAIALLSAS